MPTPTGPIVYSTAPCSLPMHAISEAAGAFVQYPSGAVTAAPDSVVAPPGGTPGQIGVNPGLAYDVAAQKWVPAPYFWLAPSGRAYLFQDYTTGLTSVVDVSSGKATQLAVPHGSVPFGTSDAGVYVQGPAPGGAWFYPFDGTKATLVADGDNWYKYNSDSIWRLTTGSGGSLVRHDLQTGKDTVLATLGGWNDILGFDAQGDPLILDSTDVPSPSPGQAYRFMVIGADGRATTLWEGAGSRAVDLAVGDDHGVWFVIANNDGIPSHEALYLWTPQTGARRITALDGNTASGISGTCA